MATILTQVPAIIDYLVTTCQNSASIGLASPPVTVLDGPDVTADIRVQQQLLWIGFNPASLGEPAATASQDWPVMDHARTLDEDGEISCAAEYWSGSTVTKVNRDGCAAIVDAVATLLRGDVPSAGPGDASMGGLDLWARVSSWTWQQAQQSDGMSVLCAFKITYRARLTTG